MYMGHFINNAQVGKTAEWTMQSQWKLCQLGCVHTNRVESSPIQSSPDSQRRNSDCMAYFQWLPRQCIHTSRVESSPVTRVLTSQQSWWCMFYFCQSHSSDRAWQLLFWGRNGCGKAYSPCEGPRGNFRCFALWAQKPRLHSQCLAAFAQEMGIVKTSASMFYFLLWW